MFLKSLVVLICLTTASAFAGGEVGGGGYQYYYTSQAHFKGVKNFLSQSLIYADKKELEALEKKYDVHIDWIKFATIIKNAKSKSLINASRENSDGDSEPLIFDYDPLEGSISALAPFFELFNKKSLTIEETNEMSRLILHEASHLVGIGVNNDDELSMAFSKDLRTLMNKYWYRCPGGVLGIQSCLSYNAPTEEVKNKVLKMEYTFFSPKTFLNKAKHGRIAHSDRVDVWRLNSELNAYVKILAMTRDEFDVYETSSILPGDILCIQAGQFNVQHPEGTKKAWDISEDGKSLIGGAYHFEMKKIGEVISIQLLKIDNGSFKVLTDTFKISQ
ncbi:MAG: hypothetical protein KBD76_04805 [Bacteriovorax sp.]|nr:hypothetical protein [Bacteriovorax sp.]